MPKVNLPGIGSADATPVQILESTERWTDIKLEDGSTIRLKPVVLSVMRVDGKYDQHGNPMYAVQAGQAMTVSIAPEHLKKPATAEAGPKLQ